METRPPKLIEALIERLVPPACRENVMGDWGERYTSIYHYLLGALGALPLIIASQVRRTFRIGLFLAEVSALCIAFAGTSLLFWPAYLYEHSALLPLVIVIGVVLLALTLCDAYGDPQDRSAQR